MRSITISDEPHRLQGSLSAKIGAIRTRFDNVRTHGSSIGVEEADAIVQNLLEMVGEARRLEDGRRDADASVPVAYDLVCQAGDEMRVVTTLLAEMVRSHTPDRDDQVRCAFARARALLERGEAVFLGRVPS